VRRGSRHRRHVRCAAAKLERSALQRDLAVGNARKLPQAQRGDAGEALRRVSGRPRAVDDVDLWKQAAHLVEHGRVLVRGGEPREREPVARAGRAPANGRLGKNGRGVADEPHARDALQGRKGALLVGRRGGFALDLKITAASRHLGPRLGAERLASPCREVALHRALQIQGRAGPEDGGGGKTREPAKKPETHTPQPSCTQAKRRPATNRAALWGISHDDFMARGQCKMHRLGHDGEALERQSS
jgi:hypothetical protein